MEYCERATSAFFSAMSSSKGYWYSLFDLDDNSFSLSQLFGVSIEELLDVFETIGFVKKVEKRDLRVEEDEEQQHLMEAELELLAEERSQLSSEDKKSKGELRERRRMFEDEAEKPENSKVEGQTARAGMEGIMKDNGINFGAFREIFKGMDVGR